MFGFLFIYKAKIKVFAFLVGTKRKGKRVKR
uniref:Uncharacterized protein n=2 Tax=unclassified Caudoviricetes TaxID=2788787 RepID=A0A8S5VBH9_9CAUD|nr:MAG TPA: hypothetical protein [Siphoviridae sp. ctfrT39]DAG03963.1 MAG TPA: hypothetical protein [Siphoviridae sp. ct0vA12]